MNQEERDGYRFIGWYIDPECTKRINPGGKLPSAITLYDKWVPILYPIHYDCHGGINSRRNPRYVTVETGLLRLFPARKRGMRFIGWCLDGDRIEYLPPHITKPLTLEAMFCEPSLVRFETNGGGRIAERTTTDSGLLERFRPPMRLGYTFDGWYLDERLTFPFDFDMPLNESITLYAKWKITLFRITYHLDGGLASRMNPRSYSYFDLDIELLPARKKGYRFLGWFDARGNALDWIRHNSIGDKELFARYEKERKFECTPKIR